MLDSAALNIGVPFSLSVVLPDRRHFIPSNVDVIQMPDDTYCDTSTDFDIGCFSKVKQPITGVPMYQCCGIPVY